MCRERIQSIRENVRLSFFKVSDNSIFKKIDLQKKKSSNSNFLSFTHLNTQHWECSNYDIKVFQLFLNSVIKYIIQASLKYQLNM